MHCEQVVSGTEGKTIKTRITKSNETDQEFKKRTEEYADKMLPLLVKNITSAINDIYTKDLKYYRQTKYLKQEYIDRLLEIAIEQNALSINNKNNEKNPDWVEETLKPLFKKKRATELAKLLKAKKVIMDIPEGSNVSKLKYLLSKEDGRQAITSALIANRKCKIGSNMMVSSCADLSHPIRNYLGVN